MMWRGILNELVNLQQKYEPNYVLKYNTLNLSLIKFPEFSYHRTPSLLSTTCTHLFTKSIKEQLTDISVEVYHIHE